MRAISCCIASAFLTAGLASPALAQGNGTGMPVLPPGPQNAPLITQGANPVIAGRIPVVCGGALVVFGNANLPGPGGGIPNIARAGIVGVNLPPAPGLPQGTPVILMDSRVGAMQVITPTSYATMVFIYAHECSHLILNHILQPVVTMEVDADCHGATLIAQQKLLTRDLMQLAASTFDPIPALPPTYPPGTQRDTAMMKCFDAAANGSGA